MSDLHSELSRKLGGDSLSSAGPPPKRQGSVDKEGAPSAKPRGSKARTLPVEGETVFISICFRNLQIHLLERLASNNEDLLMKIFM